MLCIDFYPDIYSTTVTDSDRFSSYDDLRFFISRPRQLRPLPNLWVTTPSRWSYMLPKVIALDLGHEAITLPST